MAVIWCYYANKSKSMTFIGYFVPTNGLFWKKAYLMCSKAQIYWPSGYNIAYWRLPPPLLLCFWVDQLQCTRPLPLLCNSLLIKLINAFQQYWMKWPEMYYVVTGFGIKVINHLQFAAWIELPGKTMIWGFNCMWWNYSQPHCDWCCWKSL